MEEVANKELAPDVEGADDSRSVGWGDYPLDSVFVRPETRTVGEVVKRIRANRYDLSPDFQREFVWPVEKQSRLIESCLMRLPLPVFYVAEGADGRIIVVDGLQRLTTFKRFLSNEFRLQFPKNDEDDSVPNPLSSRQFKDLQLSLQERIEDTQLTLYILDAKAPERAKLDIFERVNSGEPLTRQQMRNCLYNGSATSWLRDAAASKSFQQVTGGSLDHKKMRDREAINRFCAFTLIGFEKYRSGDMDTFLAKALEMMNDMCNDELENLDLRFEQSMLNNYALFERHAFRKSLCFPSGGRSVLNIALFDVCSTLLSSLTGSQISQQADALRAAIRELIQDDRFAHAITYSTNGTRQVQKRFTMMRQAIDKVML